MRWEYLTAKIQVAGIFASDLNAGETNEYLNELGRRGWELVSTVSINEGAGYTDEIALIFKRPLA